MGCDLPARRLSKEERLNTWLFNRRLSGEWAVTLCGRKKTKRLPRLSRYARQMERCGCLSCLYYLSHEWKMLDPNRDQRNLREETTDLWLKKRRAQQLILRRDHHLFEFYFILFESGRWKKE